MNKDAVEDAKRNAKLNSKNKIELIFKIKIISFRY